MGALTLVDSLSDETSKAYTGVVNLKAAAIAIRVVGVHQLNAKG